MPSIKAETTTPHGGLPGNLGRRDQHMIDDDENFRVIAQVFPHIGEKLKFFWGHPEFVPYIDSLQTDSRAGTRSGFPGAVLNALFALALKHEDEHPHLAPKQVDIWNKWQ